MNLQNPQQGAIDRLYLSPHLDDVALSCGGQVWQATQAGETVWIATVMAGDPPGLSARSALSEYVAELHTRWQLDEDAVAARRKEDRAACHILGAEPVHLAIPDCIYRHDGQEAFYQSDEQIFGSVDPRELNLIQEIAGQLVRLPTPRRIFAPLGIGHHVDHLLVRAAAEALWTPARLSYYEEYPYGESPDAVASGLAAPVPLSFAQDPVSRGGSLLQNWQSTVVSLSTAALDKRIQAIAAFQSQLSTFFVDDRELTHRVTSFVEARGGERGWQWLDLEFDSPVAC